MKTFGQEQCPHPKLIRGALLWPSDDLSTCTLIEDGAALIDGDGSLGATGSYEEVAKQNPDAVEEDVKGVIAPAFADLHLHWVQHHVRGRFQDDLLKWLGESIYPAEAELLDPKERRQAANAFWSALTSAGTLCAGIYGSSFEESVDDCLSQAKGIHVCGQAIMTTNSPPSLQRDPQESFEDVKRSHAKWGGGGAVAPRFALSVGEELMAILGAYAQEHGLVVQTHLAENLQEVDAVCKMFPARKNYTDVYDHAGLLGEKTILAHCIHLNEEEWDLIASRNSIVAHCPSSNLALNSGRMDLGQARKRGIDWVLASDIGAGPDLCQFDVMRAFLEIHRGKCEVSAGEAFAHASVCAVPSRLTGSKTPACLMVLKEVDASTDAEGYLLDLINAYKGESSDLIRGVQFGGNWLVGPL